MGSRTTVMKIGQNVRQLAHYFHIPVYECSEFGLKKLVSDLKVYLANYTFLLHDYLIKCSNPFRH